MLELSGMDYYNLLNLDREPFSNSPDPDYFFKSRQHFSCLQKIELAIRLRRGLNVVIGEVGTGKTTLCRQLIQRLSVDQQIETHLILDPSFDTAVEFLSLVAGMISRKAPSLMSDPRELRENIKHQLFRKGIEEKKIVCLIIDEGQKLPSYCIEILREFLNYETNEFKLMQIVLFAQEEFVQSLIDHPNFSDRVNLFRTLVPLNFHDTRLMIKYRLKLSSQHDAYHSLFTWPAYWGIYRISKGYPRKIIHLCHQSLLAMIIQNRKRVGHSLVRACARKSMPHTKNGIDSRRILTVAISFIGLILAGISIHSITTPAKMAAESEYHAVSSRYQVPMLIKERKVKISIHPTSDRKNKENQVAPSSRSDQTALLNDKDAIMPMPPFILGSLTISKQEKLEDLFRLIHGDSTQDYVESFLTLNPQIGTTDSIMPGTTVQLPAVAVATPDSHWNVYRVELANVDNLAEAKNRLMQFKKKDDHVRMIAYWSATKGLRFTICMNRFFPHKEPAQNTLEALQSRFGVKLITVRDWDKETIFFSNLSNGNTIHHH